MFGKHQKSSYLIKADLEGMSLTGVIAQYATLKEVVESYKSFDPIILRKLIAFLGNDYKNTEKLSKNIERLYDYVEQNGIPLVAIDSFTAHVQWEAFTIYSLNLFLYDQEDHEEFTEYVFKEWLANVPFHYIVPVIFPPVSQKQKLTPYIRSELLSFLLKHFIKTKTDFELLVNAYASENPLYKSYPILFDTNADLEAAKTDGSLNDTTKKNSTKLSTKPKEMILQNVVEVQSPKRAYFESFTVVWNTVKGDYVYEGDQLCELRSSSLTINIKSELGGTIGEICVREGETVTKTGITLCTIDEGEPSRAQKITDQASDNVETRLKKLQSLFDKGLITEKNFESKQAEILKLL